MCCLLFFFSNDSSRSEKVHNFAQTALFCHDFCWTFLQICSLVSNLDEHHQTGVLKLLFWAKSKLDTESHWKSEGKGVEANRK